MKTINEKTTKEPITRKEYYRIHHWLRRFYGKACKCQHPDCTGKSDKYEWALNNDFEYDFKVENFLQMCTSCHRNYDMTQEKKDNISKARTGIKYTHKKK